MKEKYLINDICDVGSSKRIYLSEYQANGIPFYRGKEIIEKDSNRDISNELFISHERYNEIKEKFGVPVEGDILMTAVGTIGVSWYVNESNFYFKDGNLIWFKNFKKDKVNSKYLYYIFKSKMFSEIIRNISIGSTQKAITIEQVKKIQLNFPKIDIQNRIVNILDGINDKIRINNEINNNLYEISKQLLLKYLNENKSSDEINISKFLNIFTGKKNANETSPTGKYKFFSCAPESLLSDTYLCDSAAIIVAGNGAYTGRTRFYDGKFELYQRTYGLTLKDGFEKNNIYGLYIFMKTIFEPDKMGGTHGSAIPYIVLSDLTDYKIKYNKVEFDRFSNLVSGNIKMIQENEKSNEKLSELRDTLLQKLMNGEIDLDNIEI